MEPPIRPPNELERSLRLVAIEDGGETLLDQGVSCIESILKPGSVSEKALSEEQRVGLKQLKRVLLGGFGEETFIPQSLLKADNKESSDYLLANFGGVRHNPKKKLKTVMKAGLFLKDLKDKTLSKQSITKFTTKLREEALFAPPQWLLLPRENQNRLRELLSWDNLAKWDFPIFEFATLSEGHPLVLMAWAILASPHAQHVMDRTCDVNKEMSLSERKGYKFMDMYKINHEALIEFFLLIENDYNDNTPYHNKTHASDVLQSLHVLLEMNGKSYATDPLQLFAVLLSAVVHDLGHPGKNNVFQVNAKTELALVYNDISVLENMHMAKTFEILMGKRKADNINIFSGLTKEQNSAIRKLMIDAVLHTDMTKHFHTVSQIKGLLKSQEQEGFKLSDDQKWNVLGFMLHIADISNPAKADPVFRQWADLCLEEFFLQGDQERELGLPISPLCCRITTKRPDSQIGFIQFVIQPAFELVGKLLPQVELEIIPIIKSNVDFWKQEKDNGSYRSLTSLTTEEA
jgi:hypothetical protein